MRKYIIQFVIFFLIGTTINIAVAWSWILFVTFEPYFSMAYYGVAMPPRDSVFISLYLPQHVFVHSDMYNLNVYEFKKRGYKHYSVSGTEVDSRGVQSNITLYILMEAGWPLKSFDGEYFMTTNGFESSFMLSVPESMYEHVEYYFLPFKPTWPGFVVNTALYGGMVWLLIYGPLDFRRFRRRKHGKCVKCGYPRGESDVCTECGLALERVASNAAK